MPDLNTALNTAQKTLLIIDDEPGIRQLLSIFLRRHQFKVLEAESGQAGLELLKNNSQNNPIDLIILDLMLPDIYGIDLCKTIRKISPIPIIILTAAQGELNTVLGFEAGADDYLEKPFSTQVLLSRIQAILRRSQAAQATQITQTTQASPVTLETPALSETIKLNFKKAYFGPWIYEPLEKKLIYSSGRLVALTQNESLLLNTLLNHPNEAVDRDTLMNLLHLDPDDLESRAVDVQISRLRNKLKGRSDINLIQSIRNKGYALLCPIRFER